MKTHLGQRENYLALTLIQLIRAVNPLILIYINLFRLINQAIDIHGLTTTHACNVTYRYCSPVYIRIVFYQNSTCVNRPCD